MIPYKHCEWRWITVTACPAGWVPDWLVHVASLLRLQYCSSNRHVLSQRFLCRRRSVNFNVTPPRRVCLLRAFFVARVTSRLKMIKCPVNHQIYEWRMSGVCLSRITCRSQSNQMVCTVPIFTLELVFWQSFNITCLQSARFATAMKKDGGINGFEKGIMGYQRDIDQFSFGHL